MHESPLYRNYKFEHSGNSNHDVLALAGMAVVAVPNNIAIK